MFNLSTADPADVARFFEAAGVGIIVFDVADHCSLHLVCTNGIYRSMYGMEHEPAAGLSVHDFLSPYIQQHYLQQFQDCCDRRVAVDDEFQLDLRGKTLWHRVRMVPVFGKDETHISRVFATSVDITQEKLLEEELGIVSARLEAIVDSTYDAIVSIDNKHTINTFNQAAEDLFDYTREEMVGKNMEVLLPQASRPQHAGHIDNFGQSPLKSRPMEARVEVAGLRRDGSTFAAEVAIAKIKVHGEVEYTAIIRDISAQMRLLDELKHRAKTDPLTGIANRRHFFEATRGEIDRCQRYDHPLSLLVLDLDNFKSINDTYGHAIGDEVLKALSRVLKKRSRKLDVPARLGGEEFCLLIPETTLEHAHELCIRLLEDIRGIHTAIPALGERVVTASIGLATYRKGGEDVDMLVQQADEAMYAAKHSGKNKVCLADCRDLRQGEKGLPDGSGDFCSV
ncbi:MAG: hypothetical protein COW19_05025 [Zetaproteobacteria bacterium CG12_big_fil_rev_8_21_14_0_65_55_1124]|nr:MAG: hypothetical protein AUJ58_00935 [Zetaproteobacteria bacterium CG1_02_55_237]PIS18507.1 MAG: hypothetical protein COT53_10525 [Zetaproteobacteria bacterium CG08_land_8_20_14_0_20_55_17]PIW43041.1 MAG: hypothetical protein COW19_05025 [Zetaproteobacteria bacterium CG12_big_fil_rev_8_21_14_0_65_55_1124]PIY52592.1 MAG: hypothetical protein COZ01_07080 [Zetaproteobacteria bacterium CG_4_10_14_0_8_um_filter_55_43]PIZ38437.1 MAG: hypothetical protein COY36_06250 [Zetaproteobacteria bacterium 